MPGKLTFGIAPGLAVWLLCASVTAETTPLRFGIFPRLNAEIMVRDFTPLVRVLSQSLERELRVETDKDFDSFMQRVYDREFDIVHLNQLQYLQAHRRAGYRVIAKICENPECMIQAVIVTRRDAGIRRVADLRGKTIAFGDRTAMVSYVLTRSILDAAGLAPGQYREIFTKNPANALLAVYNGAAEAAGVGLPVFERPEIHERLDVARLQRLALSQPIPALPVAVRADLDPQLTRRLLQSLLALERDAEGRGVLRGIRAQRFAAASDWEYRNVKLLTAETSDGAR